MISSGRVPRSKTHRQTNKSKSKLFQICIYPLRKPKRQSGRALKILSSHHCYCQYSLHRQRCSQKLNPHFPSLHIFSLMLMVKNRPFRSWMQTPGLHTAFQFPSLHAQAITSSTNLLQNIPECRRKRCSESASLTRISPSAKLRHTLYKKGIGNWPITGEWNSPSFKGVLEWEKLWLCWNILFSFYKVQVHSIWLSPAQKIIYPKKKNTPTPTCSLQHYL